MDSDEPLVSWKRVAEPQSDQYDSMITLEFARRRGYVRRPIGGAPTFFDGRVAIWEDSVPLPPPYVPARHDHPNVELACDLIRLWPSIFAQCQLLIESVSIFVDTRQPYVDVVGSTCGPGVRGFGTITSTIDSPVGFAEAILHEMAHQKLCALGVQLDTAERLITNSAEEKFPSPFNYDCLWPMPDVLHAQYSYTYSSALDIEMIRAATDANGHRRAAERSLAVNLPKLQFGLAVIREHARPDAAGADFLEGLFAWSARLLEEGYRIFESFQIPAKPFAHPLLATPCAARQSEEVAAERPRRRTSVVEHNFLDEALLYAPEIEAAFSLNNSATGIWKRCDGWHTALEISRGLGAQVGRSGDEILQDVTAAISRFRDLGLLETEELPLARTV